MNLFNLEMKAFVSAAAMIASHEDAPRDSSQERVTNHKERLRGRLLQ